MTRTSTVWMKVATALTPCALLAALGVQGAPAPPAGKTNPTVGAYSAVVRPVLERYCLSCHSPSLKRGGLDLARFASADAVRRDVKPWQGVIDHLEVGDMPPNGLPRPTEPEKQRLVAWVRDMLHRDALAHAGDPGYVPLRRLSNAEYDCTIRDLTGVDLRPTREFPADGAAGEGFTNAAEALTDVSPTLLSKYFGAAKEIAEHTVLLPDGFRLSPAKTRREWTDESTAQLRAFFNARVNPDGSIPYAAYLGTLVRHRAALAAGTATVEQIAAPEKLSAKYLRILWQTLNDATPSYPLDALRADWRKAGEKDAPALAAEVAGWQAALWRTVRIGSYVQPAGKGFAESTSRQVAANPAPAEVQPLRLTVKPAPGLSEVVLRLSARAVDGGADGRIVWQRPRFEGVGKPTLLLRDYPQFGPAFEIDLRREFADAAQYLAAAVEMADNPKRDVEELAQRQSLDLPLLNRWIATLDLAPLGRTAASDDPGRVVPAVALQALDEKVEKDGGKPAISGWRRHGEGLPVLVTNASDTLEHIPGNASPHGVMVHPTPDEFVGVVWTSPLAGIVRVRARITHAHPACGNGVAWWLEHRRGQRASMFAEGALPLGGEARPAEQTLRVEKGDAILLAVDAKDHDHSCDLTDIALAITPVAHPDLAWDLAGDIADTVLQGNPHADRHGNRAVWSFVKGPTRPVGAAATPLIPPASVLGRWREAVADPARRATTTALAQQVQSLLSGARPAGDNDPDRLLYDQLVSVDSPLIDAGGPASAARPRLSGAFGLDRTRFGANGDLEVPATSQTDIRLPAALFRGRELVVEARLDAPASDRAVAVQAGTAEPGAPIRPDGAGALVAAPNGDGYRRALAGYDRFRSLFPLYACFPNVIPTDEVVNLKMFHREDEPLARLMLTDAEARRLDKLWDEHRFISRQPAVENTYLPLFIGFVTQDQPKEMVAFFEGRRPAFRARAEAFAAEEMAAIPKQLDALLDFASRAYRRPLAAGEKTELLELYRTIRAKGAPHDEAFRGVLARILVAPAFLFRIEQAPAGTRPGPVDDWALATRLSYFLWSSAPDAELRRLAAAGRLHDPKTLAAQARRMLGDDRVRSLAVEFGAQWLHVRGFDAVNEKNEKLFPTFDAELRRDIYEETIRFFQDLFQSDRPVTDLLNADYTFLNGGLAKHYAIPGVTGPKWRRVDGVRKYGRGGVLGLASIQASQAAASRTSPVLRGNWLVETLLGERLPRPPPNVPKLPEEEGAGGVTLRQQVERHSRDPACAVCHTRIDPYGFALEQYDSIGRYRVKDLAGGPIDAKAKLKDGTQFEGVDGLRTYLLTKKKGVIVRLFCRRLLGYALGRSVANSDQPLIDEMVESLNRNGGRMSAAVRTIVLSPQFRMIRGRDYAGVR
jgi:hypothetical protein